MRKKDDDDNKENGGVMSVALVFQMSLCGLVMSLAIGMTQ
jgi:hypothetical protein